MLRSFLGMYWVVFLLLTESHCYHDRLSYDPPHVARGLIPSTWETDGKRGGLHDPDFSLPLLVCLGNMARMGIVATWMMALVLAAAG